MTSTDKYPPLWTPWAVGWWTVRRYMGCQQGHPTALTMPLAEGIPAGWTM